MLFLASRPLGYCPFRISWQIPYNFRNLIFMTSHFSTLLHSDVSLHRIRGRQQVNWRTSTGSESFSLLRCLDTTKVVFLNVFSIIETIWSKNWSKSRPKFAKRRLPVDVRRSKTSLLKIPDGIFCDVVVFYLFICFFNLRVTLLASCVMNLRTFPHDSQQCHLKFGSCKFFFDRD